MDISKDVLDLALLEEFTFGTFSDKKIENSMKGFDDILIGFSQNFHFLFRGKDSFLFHNPNLI